MRLYNFELPKSGEKVTIHDMSGREIEEVVTEPGALAKTDAMDAMEKALGE